MGAIEYGNLFDAVGDALAVIGRVRGRELRIVAVNSAWTRVFARAGEEYAGQPFERVFTAELAAQLTDACEHCMESRTTIELKAWQPVDDVAGWTLTPVSDPDTNAEQLMLLTGAAASVADEAAATGRLGNILEQTADYTVHYDREGRILFLNPALQQLFRLRQPDVLGKTNMELFPGNPEAVLSHENVLEAVRTGEPRQIDLPVPRPSGPLEWHQIRYMPLRDAQGEVVSVLAIGRELSSLKLAEERLRQSEREFRSLAEHSPDFIFRYDRELRLVYANPTVERYGGQPIECRLGTKLGEHPDSSKFHTSRTIDFIRAAFMRALHEGRRVEFELREPARDAQQSLAYSSFVVVPERDAAGNVEGILAIGRDVSQLKAVEAELRELNATLEERIAARTLEIELANRDLRSFTHTISHDLRAPLRAIVGFATLLKEDESERLSEHGQALLERIRASGFKLNHLIDDILQYSHAGQAELTRQPVALERLAQEIVSELLVQYPHASIHIGALPHVSGDPTMLRQVLQNLVNNALKFSAREPVPRVEVGSFRREGETVFYVRDNGIGFDVRNAPKLGTLFQRLHSDRDIPGSGVGLAIVQRLIERHGGRVWAESSVGAGATFFFTVPALAPQVPLTDRH